MNSRTRRFQLCKVSSQGKLQSKPGFGSSFGSRAFSAQGQKFVAGKPFPPPAQPVHWRACALAGNEVRGMQNLPQLWQAMSWLSSASSSAASFAATLPSTCRQSVAHALVTCGWGAPPYHAPGLAPLPSCWGWLLIGVLLGFMARELLVIVIWWAQSPRATSPQAGTTTAAAKEVLRSWELGGDGEITALALRNSVSPTTLLCKLLRKCRQRRRKRRCRATQGRGANVERPTSNLAIGQQQNKQTAKGGGRAGQQMALMIVLHAVTNPLASLLPSPLQPSFAQAGSDVEALIWTCSAAFATTARLPRTVGLVTAVRLYGAYSRWSTRASCLCGQTGRCRTCFGAWQQHSTPGPTSNPAAGQG